MVLAIEDRLQSHQAKLLVSGSVKRYILRDTNHLKKNLSSKYTKKWIAPSKKRVRSQAIKINFAICDIVVTLARIMLKYIPVIIQPIKDSVFLQETPSLLGLQPIFDC